MARKRSQNPIEDPAPASSSSSSSSSSEEEEETSSEEEEVEETQTLQTQKNPTLNAKPIATKSMEEASNTKKPRSKPLASPVKASSAKQEPKEAKRPKRKAGEEGTGSAAVAEEVKKTGEDAKKQLFQRLFTEDDEIAMLKGMLDYWVKKGADPFADPNAFHNFVKKSIHTDVSKAQLMYKIRRLRKKFENNAGKGKNGKDRIFGNPHEQKIFDLSKQIWGKEAGRIEYSAPKSTGKENLAALKAELRPSPDTIIEPMKVDRNWSKSGGNMFDKRFGAASLEDEVLRHGLDMIGGEKKAALEEKWRKLQIAELELFLQRNELMKEQVKLVLEFHKAQDA